MFTIPIQCKACGHIFQYKVAYSKDNTISTVEFCPLCGRLAKDTLKIKENYTTTIIEDTNNGCIQEGT